MRPHFVIHVVLRTPEGSVNTTKLRELVQRYLTETTKLPEMDSCVTGVTIIPELPIPDSWKPFVSADHNWRREMDDE
jgi:hypothetical protein